MRRFFIGLIWLGAVLMVAFTIRPITFTVEMINEYGIIPNTFPEYQRFFSNTLEPERWLFLGIGVTCLLVGVFYAKLARFWILLIAIGIISILSFSGVFIHSYKMDYLFSGDDSNVNYLDDILDNIKYLLPGLACIIGGIVLRKRINIQGNMDYR